MKALKMTLMVSITFAAMITLAATEKPYQLKYLSEVTRGKVVHTLTVKAHDFNEALTKSRKQCVSDLLDRRVASDDIVDMCANPRL